MIHCHLLLRWLWELYRTYLRKTPFFSSLWSVLSSYLEPSFIYNAGLKYLRGEDGVSVTPQGCELKLEEELRCSPITDQEVKEFAERLTIYNMTSAAGKSPKSWEKELCNRLFQTYYNTYKVLAEMTEYVRATCKAEAAKLNKMPSSTYPLVGVGEGLFSKKPNLSFDQNNLATSSSPSKKSHLSS